MGQTGEDRDLDENSEEETDEEEDEESFEEDEDVTGSEDEDDDDEDDEDEDDEDDDDDEEDDDKNGNGDEANKFLDEPKAPINGSSNIVEDYGVERVPGDDEDLEKGDRSKTSEDDSQRSKKTLGLLCCCALILAIIGIVLGVTLGKKDDESTTTKAATTLPPVPAPVTPVPIPVTLPPQTAAPTANSNQFTIPASADSYIFLSGGEEGPFGQEESLLVQRTASGESLALLNFDIPLFPPPEVLGFSPKAFLVLTLLEGNGRALMEGNATMEDTTAMEGNTTMDGNATMEDTTAMEGNTTMDGNATMEYTATMEGNTTTEGNGTLTSSKPLLTLKTGLISGYSGDIEEIAWNSSSLLEQLNRTIGTSFQIFPGTQEISVDISLLLASAINADSPDTGIVLRRLQMPGSTKILLELMAEDVDGNTGSVRFYSAQSSSPPRIKIDLTPPTTTSDCPICGNGNNVTYPEMELELPQIGNVTCGELEFIASTGAVSEENCALLQPYVYSFCCENAGSASETAGSAKIFVCDLCLDGGNITNPTTILSIAGQTNKTCGDYQGLAMQGLIPTELCAPLQLLSDEVCCGIAL